MLNESSPAVWKGTLAICFLIVVLTSGTTNLAAQSPAEFGDLPDISGTWNRVSRSNPPACGPSLRNRRGRATVASFRLQI